MGTALRKHLVSVLYPALILISFHTTTHAQGIMATRTSDGRLVYENAPEKTPEQQASAAASSDTGMVYWSNTQHRWKPVPAMNSNSMRAAQSAAAEVRRLIRRAAKSDSRWAAEGSALRLATQQVQNQSATVTELEPKQSQMRVMSSASAPMTRKTQMASLQVPQSAAWISDIVEKAALRHSVDPNLVRAIVQVESNFNPHAVSRKGAIGLMQLMPRTAKSLNVSNPYDPAQNVDAGVRHFKELLDSYGGNLELSLAAYNAGVSAVHKSGGVPHYSETRNYVKKITGIYGSNTARLSANGHPPLEIKRDAQGHLSVSDID
jgi:soluble lytic murein transglycosylase-like protein